MTIVLRLGLHVEVARDGEQALEHPANADLLDRESPDRFADGTERRRKFIDIVM
jgi:hypothetical protein